MSGGYGKKLGDRIFFLVSANEKKNQTEKMTLYD